MKLLTPVPCQTCRRLMYDTDDGQGFHFAGRAPFVVCKVCEPHVRQAAAAVGQIARTAVAEAGRAVTRKLLGGSLGGVPVSRLVSVLGPVVDAVRGTSPSEK